ncbi:MAG: hypothetical protein JWM53_815 [bacterium]|nr:hypothetical protein [bacterium]
MRVCLLFVAVVAVLGAVGCGGGTPTPAPDLATPAGADLSVYSLCGHPGDAGNSKGVGKYCMDSTMCMGQSASVCSTLMPIPQGPIYFCTLPCDPNAATSTCAEGATCTCLSANNPNLCGCVPDTCRVGLFG